MTDTDNANDDDTNVTDTQIHARIHGWRSAPHCIQHMMLWCDSFALWCDSFILWCDSFLYCDVTHLHCDVTHLHCDVTHLYCDVTHFILWSDSIFLLHTTYILWCYSFLYCDVTHFILWCDSFLYCVRCGRTTSSDAPHCTTLQLMAPRYNMLQYTATPLTECQIHLNTHSLLSLSTHTRRNTLQHTATHCNTLQHTTTHCNTPYTTLNSSPPQQPLWLFQTHTLHIPRLLCEVCVCERVCGSVCVCAPVRACVCVCPPFR